MIENAFLPWFTKWKDVITFIVAVLAIGVVVVQIRQNSAIDRAKLRREQLAARASLPLTLAALSVYGTEMLRALGALEQWLQRRNYAEAAPEVTIPRLPPETVAAVEKVIAAYPGESAASALAALLSEVQVLQSRSRDFGNDPNSIRSWSLSMKDNVVMAAAVIARCEHLFAFARDGSEGFNPSRTHIHAVLNMQMMWETNFPRVWKATEIYNEDEPMALIQKQRPILSRIAERFSRNGSTDQAGQ